MSFLNSIGGLVGPVLGFIGQKEANDTAKNAAARDSYNNSPQGIRANAEQAGFNPLTVLNSGRSFGAGYQPQFGNALGQLGQGITDAINGQEQLKIQKAELEIERQRVDQLAKAMTLGPKIPGIYGARSGYGSGTARGNSTGNAEQSGDQRDVLDVSGNLADARDKGAGLPSNYTKVEAPALTAFGIPFTGSGAFGSGQSVEDALGEGPLQWAASPIIASDMVGHTAGLSFGNWVSKRQQSKADKAMDEWFRRAREKDPIKKKKKPGDHRRRGRASIN